MAIADSSQSSLRFATEATSEVNTITSAGASAGNFTLTIFGVVTANIAFNAAAAGVQSAIETALGSTGIVTAADSGAGANLGTSGHIVTLTWTGRFVGKNVSISIQTAGLTGSPHVLATTTDGGTAAYGTSPTLAYCEARLVSETLGQDKEVVQSEEVVADRMPTDNIQVGSNGSGDLVTEVIGGGFNIAGGQPYPDDFWLAALGSSSLFTNTATFQGMNSGTITVDNVGGNTDRITLVHSATSWQAGLDAGNFCRVRGFLLDSGGGDLTYLNSVYQIVSRSGTTLTLTKGPRVAGAPKTTPTLTGPTTVTVKRIPDQVNGLTIPSFTFERKYQPITDFARMPGFCVNGFLFEMRPKRPMRITWRFLGKEDKDFTAAVGNAVVSAPSSKAFSPVSDFKSFSLNEDGRSFALTSFTLDLKCGLYYLDEEAGVGTQGIGTGSFELTGSAEFYYEGGTIQDIYQQFLDRSMHFAVNNANDDGLLFACPRINFTVGRRATPGKDQPMKYVMQWRAAKGTDPLSTTTYLLRIGRL